MRKIAIANQKGGVGKTTSAVNIGAGLSRQNKKVLLIDLDPQANLTYSLGIPAHELDNTVKDLLGGNGSFDEVIIDHDGLKVLPSNILLSGADIEFASMPGREFLLRDCLSDIENFDYIIIDCPPSLGLLTLNALTYCNEVIVPVQTEFLAIQGINQLIETIELVKKRLNSGLEITGVICTLYDQRKVLHQDAVTMIQSFFKEKVFTVKIRDNINLAEAPVQGKTIFEYQKNCYGAEDYKALVNEIEEMRKKEVIYG